MKLTTGSAGKDVKKFDYSCIDVGNIKWYSHSEKQDSFPIGPSSWVVGYVSQEITAMFTQNLYMNVPFSLIDSHPKLDTCQIFLSNKKE